MQRKQRAEFLAANPLPEEPEPAPEPKPPNTSFTGGGEGEVRDGSDTSEATTTGTDRDEGEIRLELGDGILGGGEAADDDLSKAELVGLLEDTDGREGPGGAKMKKTRSQVTKLVCVCVCLSVFGASECLFYCTKFMLKF